jgi:CobQ-like glutamine amidotransferase family enzyme
MADRAGREYRGAEVIDAATTPGPRRAVGEVVTTSTIPGVGRHTGLENHLGRTRLDPQHIPLGNIERGVGNGLPHDHPIDGVVTPTVVGAYLHGRVLARNPALAVQLLALPSACP